jgi:very-short-patch-repair endonuclease
MRTARERLGSRHAVGQPKRHRIRPRTLKTARRLRAELTAMEKKLWHRLRGDDLAGFKFRRQYAIDRFVVDFYCAGSRLIVEVDGDTHAARRGYDSARTCRLRQLGYRVVRFTNQDVSQRSGLVLDAILAACRGESLPPPWPSP